MNLSCNASIRNFLMAHLNMFKCRFLCSNCNYSHWWVLIGLCLSIQGAQSVFFNKGENCIAAGNETG